MSVIVNVYLPLLTLTLGYAQVEGLWTSVGRLVPRNWKSSRPAPMAWTPVRPPSPRDWQKEKP